MTKQTAGNKKGQQLIIPIARTEDSPEVLKGNVLKVIDLRSDWQYILNTIDNNKIIQQAMENAYQDFQEGYKLKDFKHPNGIKGAWKFENINEKIYPYTLTTTDWIIDYEKQEWEAQATNEEQHAKIAIDAAIEKCTKLEENNEILKVLKLAKNKLAMKYPPRSNQPETWRPQNASHWSSKWIKIHAEIHYKSLSDDWRMIASNTHSIVAGFSDNKTTYLIDIILLTTNPDEIIAKLNKD